MEEIRPFIAAYMMTNKPYGTLYAGVTNNLWRRAPEHRDGAIPGFTKTHGLTRLVWFQCFETMGAAIQREKTIKHCPRAWKIDLIERDNPRWDDLYEELIRDPVWRWDKLREP
jgi:putative endonuclease